MRYAVVIEKANGNFSAYVPDLPGCVATGKTVSAVEEEIREARRFFTRQGWPVIDVTRRSVEETAAEIQILLQRRKTDHKNQAELL